MKNDYGSREELRRRYDAAIWTFLSIAASAIFGFIVWLGYAVFL